MAERSAERPAVCLEFAFDRLLPIKFPGPTRQNESCLSLRRHCIMVRGLGPHRIQGCGAIDLRARKAGSPLIVIPIASSVPPCSELSRYGLASSKFVERLV